MKRLLYVTLSEEGAATARRAASTVPGEIAGLTGRVGEPDTGFSSVSAVLIEAFGAGRPVVGVMAAGAMIRILAPLLTDKRKEPPVLALSEDGSSVVPLLGGHHGANALARELARALSAHPAITTAGDQRFGIALDAPPKGYHLANPENAKSVMAALLAGEKARLTRTGPEGDMEWLRQSRIPFADNGKVRLIVGEEAVAAGPLDLVYQPRRLVLGMGAERGADPEEAVALAEETLAAANLSPNALALIASIDLKADEAAIHAVAAHFGVPARFFSAERLETEAGRLKNPSKIVFAETGCHGVAEGAALAASGETGTLIVAKQKSKRVTAALARATAPIDPATTGRGRGRLFVVGIGPGQAAWRSPEASRMIEAAGDLVGYSLYLDLLGPLAAGKTRHDFPLGEEEKRVRHAMELAGEGREVALISSGDAGIYAMATLVFELIEKGGLSDAARRIEIAVTPGISALQAAAARVGAPLGHDFCTISLSDLLTPWEVIEKRIAAAAAGDFVIAFYNPVSRRRRHQLAHAKQVLLRHRPPATPVILATNLGRENEKLRTVPLRELDIDDVDMLTVVIVGASQSRQIRTGDGRDWVYTPRGYAEKTETGIAS